MATSPNSFLEITRSLRQYVPQLPIPLAEQMIRDRYRRILERRDWSGLRREAEFILNDAKADGTVTVVRNDATVTIAGATFATTDVGRQFKIGSYPVYTIASRTDATHVELDRPYGGASASAQSYKVFDGYVTAPTDLLRLDQIVDPIAGWRLRHWITQAELNAMDPMRNFFGQPYILADRQYTNGVPCFEAWPFCTSARTLYYTYIKRGDDLIDDADIPIWPIRSDAIVSGALADVAKWPGTAEQPNPYFARPEYWRSYEMEFEDKMVEIERRDEDIYMTMVQQWPYTNMGRWAPASASFIQSHVLY